MARSPVLPALGLAVAVVLPLHLLGRSPGHPSPWSRMPATHDVAMHFDHMRSFARGLAAGRPFPRWEEPTNKGFGAPSTAFHPPGVYYLTSLVHAIAPDWGLTFLLTHVALMAGSALSLHACARRHLSPLSAAVATLAYLTLPYHVLDLYQRGALAELLTFVWMPLAWMALDALLASREATTAGRPSRLPACAGLAAAVGALFWSHPPTAFTFVLVTGGVALALAVVRRDGTGLALAALAVGLGLGLSAAYFYPAVVDQGLVRNDVFQARWAYADAYVLGPRPAEAPEPFWRALNATWSVTAAGLAACVAALSWRWRRLEGALRERVTLWSGAGGLVLVLMTPLAAPVERFVPGLTMTSFPWRMLTTATLALALVAGAVAQAALAARRDEGKTARFVLAGVCGLVVGGSLLFSAAVVAARAADAPAFVPRPDRPTADKFWVLPRWAPADVRQLPAVDPATLARGAGAVAVERWDPERRELRADVPAADRLLVRTFDFPGWTATVDGRPASIERGPSGAIEIELPAGRHEVVLDFGTTPSRTTGDAISSASLAILGGLFLAGRRRSV